MKPTLLKPIALVLCLILCASAGALTPKPTAENGTVTNELLDPNSLNLSNGGVNGGGGDEDGLEFHNVLVRALGRLKQIDPASAQKLTKAQPKISVDIIKVIFVDKSLDVKYLDYIQTSVAVNQPSTVTIMVSRERWRQLKDQDFKEAIALHEYGSLKLLEQTGYYPISGAYLTAVGGSADLLKQKLAVNRLRQIAAERPTRTRREILKRYYEEAGMPIELTELDQKGAKPKWTCVANYGNENDTGPAALYRDQIVTAPGTPEAPAAGPLLPTIPATPPTVEWRINVDSNLTNFYFFLPASKPLIIRQFELGQKFGYGNSAESKITVRKNNGLLSFKVEYSAYENFGYCY